MGLIHFITWVITNIVAFSYISSYGWVEDGVTESIVRIVVALIIWVAVSIFWLYLADRRNKNVSD